MGHERGQTRHIVPCYKRYRETETESPSKTVTLRTRFLTSVPLPPSRVRRNTVKTGSGDHLGPRGSVREGDTRVEGGLTGRRQGRSPPTGGVRKQGRRRPPYLETNWNDRDKQTNQKVVKVIE